jgi:hypothetical protein
MACRFDLDTGLSAAKSAVESHSIMDRYELRTGYLYLKFALCNHKVPHRRRTFNGAQTVILTSCVVTPTAYLRDNVRTRNPKGALVPPSI